MYLDLDEQFEAGGEHISCTDEKLNTNFLKYINLRISKQKVPIPSSGHLLPNITSD